MHKAKNVLNMDESGAQIGCPTEEEVVVPIQVKELYTSSPENHKSVTIMETIIADGKEPIPPLIICPGVTSAYQPPHQPCLPATSPTSLTSHLTNLPYHPPHQHHS